MKSNDIVEGIKDGILFWPLYLPIAFSYAITAKMANFSPFETILWSAMIFAGMSQLVSLIILMNGGGLFEILISTFMVNLRHSLVSLSISPFLNNTSKKMLTLFAFGVVTSSAGLIPNKAKKGGSVIVYGLSTQFCQYVQWIVFTFLGIYIGEIIPQAWYKIFSFGAIAAFIGMLMSLLSEEPKKESAIVILSSLIAVTLSLVISPYLAAIIGAITGGLAGLLPNKQK